MVVELVSGEWETNSKGPVVKTYTDSPGNWKYCTLPWGDGAGINFSLVQCDLVRNTIEPVCLVHCDVIAP